MKRTICLFLCAAMLFCVVGCAAPHDTPRNTLHDLTLDVGEAPINTAEDALSLPGSALAAALLKAANKENENRLLSPLSVYLALAMLENGAVGETKSQIDALLGQSREELNETVAALMQVLPDNDLAKIRLANSVWLKDTPTLHVKEEYLSTVKSSCKANVFKAPFDKTTVDSINGWIGEKTDGMIDKLLEDIDEDVVMYLINTLLFDAEWVQKYAYEPRDYPFTTANGLTQTVKMMYSHENTYLHDGNTEGFIKPYKGGYHFAALLPKTKIDKYIDSLTAEKLEALLGSANGDEVNAGIPVFSYDDDLELGDTLKALGMSDAFSGTNADFTAMATSDEGNIAVGRVLHKTHIDVDTLGTRAAAVTAVEMYAECAEEPQKVIHSIVLDRPFIFLILDPSGNVLFIGAVKNIKG